MAVFRINKTEDFTVMSNHHLRDKQLSLKAKGLLSVMLALPDNWDYSIDGLVSLCKEEETSVISTLKELKSFGYLRIDKLMPNETKSGRIEYIYNIFEIPQEKQAPQKQGVENQGLEFQGLEFQELENHTQLNTNISNTNIINTNKKERKKGCRYDEILSSFSLNGEVKTVFVEFIKMRMLIKKPLTDYALTSIVEKVKQLSNGDSKHAVAILKQSIRNNWQDVYEIKDGYVADHEEKPKKKNKPSNFETAEIKEKVLKDKELNAIISEKKQVEYTMADFAFKNQAIPEQLQRDFERLSESINNRLRNFGYSADKLKNIGLVF